MRGGSGRRPGDSSVNPVFSFLDRGTSAAPAREPLVDSTAAKKRVLFVCIGNAARSQMAEAFARAYGSDVMAVQSAGTSPANMLAPYAVQLLEGKGIRTDDQFPKGVDMIRESFDLVVNMSGQPLTVPATRTIQWNVPDPGGQKEEAYQLAAQQIETLVMRLILELRTA